MPATKKPALPILLLVVGISRERQSPLFLSRELCLFMVIKEKPSVTQVNIRSEKHDRKNHHSAVIGIAGPVNERRFFISEDIDCFAQTG